MSRSRLLLTIAAALLGLVMLLWLVELLLVLYARLAVISGLLAQVVIGLILLLLAVLIGGLIYYAIQFLRPRQRRSPPVLPNDRPEVAEKTLEALRQQVDQIQDEVTRQVLLERSQELEASFARGPVKVVIFGTGSAGKTSIVNAIMGRFAGEVGAAMGTTTTGETYRLRLRGLAREVHITDTPGILEAGVMGTQREQDARTLAIAADLLVFVVDGDLRQSEYLPLQSLVEIGKRSLLVLNKTDLYTDDDRDAILQRLRDRLSGLISPEDIVAIAANPQPLPLETGEWVTPDSDIAPLLRRIAAVLRAEGEDLVADNLLLQFQRLSDETRQFIDAQRRQQADKIIDRYQWIGAGVVSLTPLPLVDLLATAAINAQMVIEIGRVYGCKVNIEHGKALAGSLAKTLISLGVVRGATELFSLALQTNVSTFVIGKAVQGATAAYLTRIAGKSFVEYFRRDQDWGDGGITEVVQTQFQLNRRDEFIKVFVQDSFNKLVKPLMEE